MNSEGFGRMPRPQECDAEFSDSTNANWQTQSGPCVVVRSSSPENEGQRQGSHWCPPCAKWSSSPEIVVRRYTFKLYPNREQASALVQQAALLAQLWNAALEQRETQWAHECQRKSKGERKGLTKYDQQKELKQLRAENPEYAAIGQNTEALCLTALDDAFKAFFKRAKGGAGKSSGYPRYKSPYAIENKGADCTIWHRDHRKGWRLDQAGKNFRVYAKGIPGTIKARGKFPVDLNRLELRDMRLIRVGGIWQCSIVVKMEARRAPGTMNLEVALDLIDQFATVKNRANGQCLPGWEPVSTTGDERISPNIQGVNQQSAAEASELGAGGRFLDLSGTLGGAAEASEVQSEGDTRFKRGSYRWKQNRKRVAKRLARDARRRKEALHLTTTRLIRQAAELTVIAPPIRESTKSAKGDEKSWGAAVKTVAMLNRHVLSQAPALAIQMLEYKAAEAGIPFARITPDEHALAIGRDLPEATKAARKARRIIKEIAA